MKDDSEVLVSAGEMSCERDGNLDAIFHDAIPGFTDKRFEGFSSNGRRNPESRF